MYVTFQKIKKLHIKVIVSFCEIRITNKKPRVPFEKNELDHQLTYNLPT